MKTYIPYMERTRSILRYVEEHHQTPPDLTATERDRLSDMIHEEGGELYLTTLGEMELEDTVEIRPATDVGSCKQHTIYGLSAEQIALTLGFTANQADDPRKVKFSWGFTVNGKECAVWDWKGSHLFNEFSAYGPVAELSRAFGPHLRVHENRSWPENNLN